MYQERQLPWRGKNEWGEPGGGRCIPKDGQLSGSGERCWFVDDKADAGIYKPAAERVIRLVERCHG
jgi:hypothetical protein